MSPRRRRRSRFGHAIDTLPIDENRASIGPKQSENELEHDRFPGAARAEQNLHASLRDAETDVAKDDVIVEGERHLVEHNGGRCRALSRHPWDRWRCPAIHFLHHLRTHCRTPSNSYRLTGAIALPPHRDVELAGEHARCILTDALHADLLPAAEAIIVTALRVLHWTVGGLAHGTTKGASGQLEAARSPTGPRDRARTRAWCAGGHEMVPAPGNRLVSKVHCSSSDPTS